MCRASCGMFVVIVYLVIMLIPILELFCGLIQRPFMFSRILVDFLLLIFTAAIYIIIGNIVSISCLFSFNNLIIKSTFLGFFIFLLIGSISFAIIYGLSKESAIKNAIILISCQFCLYLCFLVPVFSVRVAKITSLNENLKKDLIDIKQVIVNDYPMGGLVIFDGKGNHYVNVQTTFYRWYHLKHSVSSEGIVFIRLKNDFFTYDLAHKKIAFICNPDLQKRITTLPGMEDAP